MELWESKVSHIDAAGTAGASTPRWELHNPPQRRKGNPERGEEGERGEAEGEEKGEQTKDNRTDSKGTPKVQQAWKNNNYPIENTSANDEDKNKSVGDD